MDPHAGPSRQNDGTWSGGYGYDQGVRGTGASEPTAPARPPVPPTGKPAPPVASHPVGTGVGQPSIAGGEADYPPTDPPLTPVGDDLTSPGSLKVGIRCTLNKIHKCKNKLI